MKNTILAAALTLPFAATAMAAEITFTGITHQGAIVSYSHQSADNMGNARKRFGLGDDWSGTVRVHVEFDGSQWPTSPHVQHLKDYWSSTISIASSTNDAFMTLHPLTEWRYPDSCPQYNPDCMWIPVETEYGKDFDSNTLTGVAGSRTLTKDLLSLDFDLTLLAGVDYYLFLDTGGSTDLWPWLPYTIQVSTVPLPASAWLLGSSLLGLAGLHRRSARKSC